MTDEVVEVLELAALPSGAMVELVVTGTLFDGTTFSATDCVRLVPPGTPPGLMVIRSNASDPWINTTPRDNNLDGGGFANFERSYPLTSAVWLEASAVSGSQSFARWVVDGVPQPHGLRTVQLIVTGNHKVFARYVETKLRYPVEKSVLAQ